MVISSASLAQSQLYLGRRQQLKSRSVIAGAGSTRARNIVVPHAVASPCLSSSSSSSRHRRCLVGANDAADAAPASLERVHRQTVSSIVAASVALSVAIADAPNAAAAAAAPSKQGEPSAVQLYETLSSSSSTSSSSGWGSSSGAKKTTKFKQRSLDSGDASYKAKRQDEAAAPTVKVSTKALTKAVTPKEIPAFAAPRQQEVLLQVCVWLEITSSHKILQTRFFFWFSTFFGIKICFRNGFFPWINSCFLPGSTLPLGVARRSDGAKEGHQGRRRQDGHGGGGVGERDSYRVIEETQPQSMSRIFV